MRQSDLNITKSNSVSTTQDFSQAGIKDGSKLPFMESFDSIQGEGFHQGKSAFFIRLAGCDVGCVWCDTMDSWDASMHKVLGVVDIAEPALNSNAKFIVVTGGEPLTYNLDKLCNLLKKNGLKMHLETSAAYPLSGEWDWICASPKKFMKPLDEVVAQANELKIVVFNKSDLDWAEEYASKVGEDCYLFLQPEWDKREEVIPMIEDYVRSNPKWNISFQVHKYLNLP